MAISNDPGSLRRDPIVAIAGWLLRLAVLGHALGIAAAIFGKLGSGLGTYFFLEWGFSHPQVAVAERWAAWGLLVLAALACLRPWLVFLVPIALAIFLDAWARQFNGGAPFAEWTIGAHALRMLVPLALAALYLQWPWTGAVRDFQRRGTMWLLRAGLAVLFITHGFEALRQHPRFIDYLIGTADRWTPLELSEAAAVSLLRVIGVFDIVVGIAVLVRPWAPLLAWMAFWGFVTALSRVTSLGIEQYFEILLRTSHFLAPIAVLLLAKSLATRRNDASA